MHIMGTLLPAWRIDADPDSLQAPLLFAHGRYDYTVPYVVWDGIPPTLPNARSRFSSRAGTSRSSRSRSGSPRSSPDGWPTRRPGGPAASDDQLAAGASGARCRAAAVALPQPLLDGMAPALTALHRWRGAAHHGIACPRVVERGGHGRVPRLGADRRLPDTDELPDMGHTASRPFWSLSNLMVLDRKSPGYSLFPALSRCNSRNLIEGSLKPPPVAV